MFDTTLVVSNIIDSCVRAWLAVGTSLDPETRETLGRVADHFAQGNRSEFVRIAVRDYAARMRRDALNSIRDDARAELGGTPMTLDQIMALVKEQTRADT